MINLFDYQLKAKNKINDWVEEGDTEIVNTLVSVMASGKTSITCAALGELIDQGKRVWIIVDRVELLNQWHSELLKFNPNFDKRNLWFISSEKKPIYQRPLQFVQVQTLTSRLSKIPDHLKPDVVILDEAHATGFQRIIDKLRNQWDVKQINLTATPVRHGSSQQQYIDKFPLWQFPDKKNPLKGTGKKYWYQAATAKEMIAIGRWKKPMWIVASEELALKTALRFSGMKVCGGEYDSTAQSDVMIDLLPDHLIAWQANGGDKHSCIWYCVDIAHSKATHQALLELGRRAAIITGKSSPRERRTAIERYKTGDITDLINCQCLTTGFDAPIASCAVWLRRTMSVGLFCQMSGRVLRRFEGSDIGLLLDLAGNLALHPFPEDIDWWDHNPSKRLFRDPSLVVCKNCKHRHDAIPTPIHPNDSKVAFRVGLGCFDDGYELPIKSVLTCHSCKAPVFADIDQLGSYALWLKCVASAVVGKSTPPKFEGHTAGISIGLQESLTEIPLTIETMYELGIWKFSNGTKDRVANKDRSNEYNTMRIKLLKNLSGREVREMRFNCMSEEQQAYMISHPVAEIEGIIDINGKYRTAFCYAYVNDNSPIWSFNYWNGVGSPPKEEVIEALRKICVSSPDGYDLLKNWIAEHLEKHTKHKHKGTCRLILKCLASLKSDEDIAA